MRKIKHYILLILLSVCSLPTYAYDFEVDGVYYDLRTYGTSVCCYVSGARKDITSLVVPDSVTVKGRKIWVYGIADGAFENDKRIKELVSKSNLLIDIGKNAFKGSSIAKLSIRRSVLIGECAFSECNELKSLDLSQAIISEKAFARCNGLKIVELAYPDLYDSCFWNCTSLQVVNVIQPDIVQNYVFADCTSLRKVYWANTLYDSFDVGFREGCTFKGCSALVWLSIPAITECMSESVVQDCKNLRMIGLKSSTPPVVASAGYLNDIKSKATLYVPAGTRSAYKTADYWSGFGSIIEGEMPDYEISWYTNSSSGENIEPSPESTQTVSGNLTGAVINEINAISALDILDLSTATIASDIDNAYYTTGSRCESYSNPNVDELRKAPYYSYAYYTSKSNYSHRQEEYSNSKKLVNVITQKYCSDLTNANLNANVKILKLPASLTSLGENAIKGDNLTNLYVYSERPPTASASSFGNTSKVRCVLHVPQGCIAKYRAATAWGNFKSIVEIGTTDTATDLANANYIAVQPTNDSRKVKLYLADPKAKYQWYKSETLTGKTRDITNMLSSTTWKFDGSEWQSNVHNQKSLSTLSLKYSDFNEGDVLSFDWEVSSEEIFDQLQCYFCDKQLFSKSGEESGTYTKKVTFVESVKGDLKFIFAKDESVDWFNDNAKISNVKITSPEDVTYHSQETLIGETSNVLTDGAAANGDEVFCIVTLSDGTQLRSESFVVATTGIEDVDCDAKQPYPVFSLSGVKVMQTTNDEDINTLPKGIYVVKGEKKIVK